MSRFDGVRWTIIPVPGNAWVLSLVNIPGKGIIVGAQNGIYLYDEHTRQFQAINWNTPNPEYRHVYDFQISETSKVFLRKRKEIFILEDHLDSLTFEPYGKVNPVCLLPDDVLLYHSLGIIKSHLIEGFDHIPERIESIPSITVALLTRENHSNHRIAISSSGQLSLIDFSEKPQRIKILKQVQIKVADIKINSAIRVDPNRIALATEKQGVILIDESGRVLKRIDSRHTDMLSNKCYQLMIDQQQSLWIPTDRGIVNLQINAPVTFYDSHRMNDAFVLDVLNLNTSLWMGTSTGMIVFKWDELTQEPTWSKRSTIQNQYFNIEKFGSEHYALVENNGMFRLDIDKGQIDSTPLVEYYNKELEYLPKKKWIFLTDKAKGLSIWKLHQGYVKEIARTKEFTRQFYKTDLDEEEILWLTANPGEIYYLQTRNIGNESLQILPQPTLLKGLSGNSSLVSLELGNNETIVAKGKSLFRIDRQFFLPEKLTIPEFKDLSKDAEILLLTHLKDSYYTTSILNNQEHEHLLINLSTDQTFLKYEQLHLLDGFRYAVSEKGLQGFLWCFSSPGAAKVDLRVETYSPAQATLSFNTIVIGEEQFTPDYNEKDLNLGSFPSKTQSIQVQVSYPSFINKWNAETSRLFDFKLQSHRSFQITNFDGAFESHTLLPGQYTLQVIARDALHRVAKPITLNFRILSPWYATWIAILIYIALGIALFALVLRWRLNVQKDKLWMERVEMERRLQIDSSAKEAQIQALRLQINPHFLFNSLNFISNSLKDNIKVKESVDRLAAFLKHALEARNSQLISLQEEIQAIHQYLAIEHQKSGGIVDVTFDIEPESASILVPGLIIQPIVENALKYGETDTGGQKKISLTAYIEDKLLVVSVSNTGSWRNASTDRTPIGLKNVEQRLKLQYGETAQLEIIKAKEQNRVSVLLKIPIEN